MKDYFDNRYTIKAYFAIVGVAMLIAGWLADTRIGRYKVVRSSIWIMWIAAVIATMSSVVAHLYESHDGIHRIYELLFVCVNLSLAMILAYTCNHVLPEVKERIKQNSLKLA
jgi:dipeptide/tripeptide permease